MKRQYGDSPLCLARGEKISKKGRDIQQENEKIKHGICYDKPGKQI